MKPLTLLMNAAKCTRKRHPLREDALETLNIGVDMPQKTKSLTVPGVMQARYAEITAMTDALCRDKLNEEYAQVCREMTATLARKRLSPLVGGHAKSWACAIAYTVGSVNFLFDKSQIPTLRADELCAWFGLSKSTGGN